MHFQPNRRSFVRMFRLVLGSSVLAACGPTLSSAKQTASTDSGTRAQSPTGVGANAPDDEYLFAAGPRLKGNRGSAKLEYANLPAGGALTLLDLANGPGVVSHLWLAINSADSDAREQTEYRIYVDGEQSPSVKSTLVGFHAAGDVPNSNFATRFVGYSHKETSNSYFAYIPIPFTSGIKIDIVNGSSRAAALVFAIADYHTELSGRWGRLRKLYTFEQRVVITPYDWLDLLKVSNQPEGAFWGVYLRMRPGNASFGYLEGNLQVFTDHSASPSYESSGTEDYFNNAWYFQTGVIFADQSGCTRYSAVDCGIGAYRFHVDDPIPFDNSIQVRWQNGTVDQASVTTPTDVHSHVWYYTS